MFNKFIIPKFGYYAFIIYYASSSKKNKKLMFKLYVILESKCLSQI